MLWILRVFLLWAFAVASPGAQSPAQSASSANAPNLAGIVDLVEGDVTVYDRVKAPRRVRVGDRLYEGEGVVTGRDGELHVAMNDGGYLAIRPNTNMSILAYQAQGREDDRSILNLVAGSFRSITGWVGRYNPRAYRVQTPTATIGIRGTDHEPLVIADKGSNGTAGTYDKVNAGGTYIESVRGYGRIEVTANRAGFAPLRGAPTPRLLAQVPRFYRPTRNEHRLSDKHRAIERSFDRLREDRRRMIDDRRRSLDERKGAPKAELKDRRDRRREQDEEMRPKGTDRPDAREARGKGAERRAEQQSQERTQRAEEPRPQSEERIKPKPEVRKSDSRKEAPRGRHRD